MASGKTQEHDEVRVAQRPAKTTTPQLAAPIHQPPVSATMRRAAIDPRSLDRAGVMQLQRTIGNAAVGRLLTGMVENENRTGLPDRLKAGVEHLSGVAMDDVRVHYNSPKPAEVEALAYTKGTEIHVAPGQEQHLPHEAWHVVQQKEGRVPPTIEVNGIAVNDDPGLERDADVMGSRAKDGPLPQDASDAGTAGAASATAALQRRNPQEEEAAQRQPLEEEEEPAQRQPIEEEEEPRQRQVAEEEEEVVQGKFATTFLRLDISDVRVDDPLGGGRARASSPVKAWTTVPRAPSPAVAPPPARRPGRPAGATVQRALTKSAATGDDKATIDGLLGYNTRTQFTSGEVLSNTWGAASSTAAFTGANGSDDIDGNKDVTYNGTKIGYLRPVGTIQANGRFDPHVKMHLVNSFIDTGANGWADNWVFGAHQLNSRHTVLENAAKLEHPNNKAANYGLSYRTEVVSYNHTNTNANGDDFRDRIHATVAAAVPYSWSYPSQGDITANAQIDAQTLTAYAGLWNTAHNNNVVARKVQVEYQGYQLDKADKVQALGVVPDTAESTHASQFRYVHTADEATMVGAKMTKAPPNRAKRLKTG